MKFTECLFSNRIRKAALALAFSGASLFAVGQPMDMSGTYTVNGTSNYAGRQFATFEEATDSLESRGVSGAVIIEAVNGTYDEHFTVGPIPGSSDANRITLTSQSGDSTDVVLTYTGYSTEEENYIIHLQGVSFLTIRGMTFDATPNQASGYGTAIRLRGDVDSTIIENCVFFGKDGSGGSAYKTLVSAHYLNYSLRSLTNDYNIVRNNLFTKGESAVGFYAYSGSYPHVGNIVENNICEDQTYLAIWSHSGLALTITGNTITNSNPDFNPSGVFIDNVCGVNAVYDQL